MNYYFAFVVLLHLLAGSVDGDTEKRHLGLVLTPPLIHPLPYRPKYLPPHRDDWELEDGSYRYLPPKSECPVIDRNEPATCEQSCIRDSDCYGVGEKCCSNGCGQKCLPGVHLRPGRCPPKSTQPVPCVLIIMPDKCKEDRECPWNHKCCQNDCNVRECQPTYRY